MSVHAQERVAYRVEIIVFRLVNSDFPPEPSELPRDFSDALDLAKLETERQDWITLWENMDPVDASQISIIPPLTPEASQFTVMDGISYLPEKSEQMSGVWRNLRLSAEYRPEAYLSWQQRAEGEFPDLRMHNEEVILIEDDFFSQRTMSSSVDAEKQPQELPVYQYNFADGSLAAGPLPMPRAYYSVDGVVRMRRSRFLHIDLDLDYRQPAPATRVGYSGPPLRLMYQGYHSYPLKQSRQVRTGRMEYFDSPVLGALVWVTAIEKAEEETVQ